MELSGEHVDESLTLELKLPRNVSVEDPLRSLRLQERRDLQSRTVALASMEATALPLTPQQLPTLLSTYACAFQVEGRGRNEFGDFHIIGTLDTRASPFGPWKLSAVKFYVTQPTDDEEEEEVGAGKDEVEEGAAGAEEKEMAEEVVLAAAVDVPMPESTTQAPMRGNPLTQPHPSWTMPMQAEGEAALDAVLSGNLFDFS